MLANEIISAKMIEVRKRIRKVQLLRGILITATIAVAGVLLMMLVDFAFAPLSDFVRWALFIIWIASTIVAARIGFIPFSRKLTVVQIARWIEVRRPEMQERLSTVLDLGRQESSASAGLLEALGNAANLDVASVDPDSEIKSAATKKRWLRPAIAMFAVLALVLAIWPNQSGRLLVRAIAPFSDLGNAGASRFKIEPGNIEVFSGDPVTIVVNFSGNAETIELWIAHDGENPFPQILTRSGKTFTYHLDPAVRSFRYYARAARAISDTYEVNVLPLPEMLDPRLILDFPEYTELRQRNEPLGKGLEAVEGTMVTLLSPTNSPLDSAWLEIDGNRIVDAKIETSATGGRVAFSWRLSPENAGFATVSAKHQLGRSLELASFSVDVLPDLAPQVLLISPASEEIRVRFDERVPLRYEVAEDFAVARIELEIDAGGDRKTSIPQDLPLRRSGNAKPPVFDGNTTVAVGKIRELFPDSREARIRITATDNRPAEPGIGSSRWLALKFEEGAESLARQELREEHEGARGKIEEAIRDARDAKDNLSQLQSELKKADMPDWAQEKFEKANAKLAKTQEKLEELAQQMEESIHAAKAEDIAEAAEKLEDALAKSESAPLQDNAETREKALNSSKKLAEQAIAKLEKARDEINADQQRVDDLARFQELAQQQEELARQAQQNLETPLPEQQQEHWQRQQNEMARQLAEQVKERPETLAEALAAQAKQAEYLAQEAEELAETQSQLQQLAAQQAEPTPQSQETLADALKQALADQQQSISAGAQAQLEQALKNQSEIADSLPEATSAAEETLRNIKQDDLDGAAESAKKSAEAMKNAAATDATQQAALSAFSERQEKLAAALENLSEGELSESLAAVQAMQAEAAAKLSKNLDSLPEIDPSNALQQASQSSEQAAESAENAAQQGADGAQANAAPEHSKASEQLSQTAEQLTSAAQSLAKSTEKAAAQLDNPQKAPVSASDLAAAAQQAAQAAATDEPSGAAESAAEAAQSLAQAAEAARSEMSGKPKPPTGPPKKPGNAGDQPSEDPSRPALPDPGVPPELAKLGISAEDWEKIQAALSSDVAGGGIDGVPAEYRGLVKGYFQSMSQK